ncbi:phosphotransferase [Actinomadura rupiterrae]|uniref:phosphotransferase n=1 Tax=Actinomadura rupiterrae TaxID=559627 RepID=UPI0020A60F5F|nr:phosphotransferase [Actinomadura rupiterrae]MCP2335898.1 aminoglycoside phosphotransferase (APT) family kinase protein [Actinomadura rupiterrae]
MSAQVIYDRNGVLVVRSGDVVAKAHRPGRATGPEFARRAEIAASLPELFCAPLSPPLDVEGRTVTLERYGTPVDPFDPPWEDAARLLAALHAVPVPKDTPPFGRPTRVARAVSRLGDGEVADAVRRAFAVLPAWVRGDAPVPVVKHECLLHGDFHLGQLVRAGEGGTWRMIDVEDIGCGDPAWDLARLAALFAAGILPPEAWGRFLYAYREAGGVAVPPDEGSEWTVLDVPSRALVVQIAATSLRLAAEEGRDLAPEETGLVAACVRIADLPELP